MWLKFTAVACSELVMYNTLPLLHTIKESMSSDHWLFYHYFFVFVSKTVHALREFSTKNFWVSDTHSSVAFRGGSEKFVAAVFILVTTQ